jgi:hypothetical protein
MFSPSEYSEKLLEMTAAHARYFITKRSAIPTASTATGIQKWLSVNMAFQMDCFIYLPCRGYTA